LRTVYSSTTGGWQGKDLSSFAFFKRGRKRFKSLSAGVMGLSEEVAPWRYPGEPTWVSHTLVNWRRRICVGYYFNSRPSKDVVAIVKGQNRGKPISRFIQFWLYKLRRPLTALIWVFARLLAGGDERTWKEKVSFGHGQGVSLLAHNPPWQAARSGP